MTYYHQCATRHYTSVPPYCNSSGVNSFERSRLISASKTSMWVPLYNNYFSPNHQLVNRTVKSTTFEHVRTHNLILRLINGLSEIPLAPMVDSNSVVLWNLRRITVIKRTQYSCTHFYTVLLRNKAPWIFILHYFKVR